MELLDVYDDNGKKTGKVVERGSKDDLYHFYAHHDGYQRNCQSVWFQGRGK